MLKLLDRWSRRIVIGMLLLLPLIALSTIRLPVGSAGVHEWLPDGRPERERYERFLAQFGSDQFLLISWEGCKANDPRLSQMLDQLGKEPSPDQPLFESIQSSVQIVRALTDAPLQLPLREAITRLQGILVGPKGLCAIVAKATPHALKHQQEVMEHVRSSADRVEGLGRAKLRIAGTVYESHAVDAAAEQSLKQLALPSMIIGIFLACVCLRSIVAAMAVLIIAGIGTLLAVSLVAATGGHFSAVLIILPTLVFMLTLSSAVHLMHYYVEASLLHSDHLGSRALLLGFKPSLLSSLTTSLGMASLMASQLAPVREFGMYSSTSLCVATAFLLAAFPALSDWFYARMALAKANKLRAQQSGLQESPVSASEKSPSAADEGTTADETVVEQLVHEAEHIIAEDTHAPIISPVAVRYTEWMNRHAIHVSCGGLALIIMSMIGLSYLQPSTKFDDMFPPDSPTISDMRWLEENLGPIASVEVLVRFPATSPLDTWERLVWIDRICESIRHNPKLGVVMSATTFLPEMPRTGSLRDVTRRSVLRSRLEEIRPLLEEQGWVRRQAESVPTAIAIGNDGTPSAPIHSAEEVWRVTVKVSATSPEDYGLLTQRVTEQVTEIALSANQAPPFTIDITGLYPVMHSTQLSLIDDLQISFTAAFVLITPVMMLIARGFWAGLLIMIPNVLPETLVFGMMAWLGFRLDIAGLLTASVAMGIAVNDTLHFVNWYARRLAAGDTRKQAVADALSSCASAMFHTMLISCCSMIPFLFAGFLPTRQFAFLMIAMLGSAILGDLVLLPGMLLSPLGKCLLPRKKVGVTGTSVTGTSVNGTGVDGTGVDGTGSGGTG